MPHYSLPGQIETQDPEFTRQVHRLYEDCLFDKLWESALPGLPYRFFSISGAGDSSYAKCQLLWDTMFILVVFPAQTEKIEVRCDQKPLKSSNVNAAAREVRFTGMPGKTYLVSKNRVTTRESISSKGD